ncbi:MAG TPA: glutamate--tRNA ligase [Longimicrobiaceae bacterium]|nr:glutamate--tRNA ligase [Longimicrobiaceae bacterium]
MSDAPRVRFAPSPTGYLHVGGARTALFNWLFARGTGGAFVLRIEDTDRERSSDEMTQAILDGMRWLGLDWDEGPHHQADGFDRHRGDCLRLLGEGKAYRCFCTPEELKARREAAEGGQEEYRYDRGCLAVAPEESERRAAGGEAFTLRFRVPEGETAWDDVVHGPTRFRNEDVEDFIILRSDGTPIYNLAVVSDDVEMRITHVIRGDDHLSNTPKQILLYRALGAPVPTFAHVPMILGPDGKRLSKRHGATAVGEYASQGILPTAMVNFLALLGWNPGDEEEVMLPYDLVGRFSLERINKKSAVFDTDKLLWMNGRHLSLTPSEELLALVAPELQRRGVVTEQELAARRDWLRGLVDLLKTRGRTVGELADQLAAYLAPELEYEPDAAAKHWKDADAVAARLSAARDALDATEPWEPAAIEASLRGVAEREGVAFGKVVHPLRLALTGSSASPGIDLVVAAVGRELVAQRLDAAVARLRSATVHQDR